MSFRCFTAVGRVYRMRNCPGCLLCESAPDRAMDIIRKPTGRPVARAAFPWGEIVDGVAVVEDEAEHARWVEEARRMINGGSKP